MNTPKLSFIVPVFNGEKFLPKLISCFEKQTYTNLEFVFVDDASFDNTSSIILNFKARDPRVVYFRHEINQGTYVTRAYGYKLATGDFLSCVDADDTVSENFAELVIKNLLETKSDMCLAETTYVFEDGKTEPVTSIFTEADNGIIKNGEGFDRFFATKCFITQDIYTWCKVVSRKLYKKCQPAIEEIAMLTKTPLSGGEDLIFTAIFAINSEKMSKCYDAIYYYYRHPAQSTALNTVAKYESQYSSACKTLYFIKMYLEKIKMFDKYAELYKGWQHTYNIIMEQDAMKLNCKRLYYKIAYEHNLIPKRVPDLKPAKNPNDNQ